MTPCSVYWIHSPNHSNMFAEGYIGVSKDVNKRWNYGHKGGQKNNCHDNIILSNAINKYGWDNLIKEIILVADSDYCYDIEKKLRPEELIGWNISIGGNALLIYWLALTHKQYCHLLGWSAAIFCK